MTTTKKIDASFTVHDIVSKEDYSELKQHIVHGLADSIGKEVTTAFKREIIETTVMHAPHTRFDLELVVMTKAAFRRLMQKQADPDADFVFRGLLKERVSS
jgi:hypothetical protein